MLKGAVLIRVKAAPGEMCSLIFKAKKENLNKIYFSSEQEKNVFPNLGGPYKNSKLHFISNYL